MSGPWEKYQRAQKPWERYAKAAPRDPLQSQASGLVDSFTQGATLGFGDELTGLESAVLGRTPEGDWFDYSRPFGERYDRAVAAERGQQDRFTTENPITSTALEIGGAMATGSGLAGRGLTFMRPTTSRAGTIAGGAAEGAAYGAASGAGNADDGDRLAGARSGALLGAATGGALSGAVDSVARGVSARRYIGAAPAGDALEDAAERAFEAAKAKNPSIEGFDAFAERLTDRLLDEGLHRSVHPRAAGAVRSLNGLRTGGRQGGAVAYKSLATQRKILQAAAKSPEPDERRIASIAIRELDDFLARELPELRPARDAYARAMRAKEIDDVAARAERRVGTGGDYERSVRSNVRAILENPRRRRGFNDTELAAMEMVARGSSPQRVLSFFGRFSPDNRLAAALGLGATAYNPAMATLPALGYAAKTVAERNVTRQLDELGALIRSGHTPVRQPTQGASGHAVRVAAALGGLGQ